MEESARQQTLRHLRLLAAYPGYWELRALRRTASPRMEPRGSTSFHVASSPGGDLLFDGVDHAVSWALEQDAGGAEVFVGVNPRSSSEGKGLEDVAVVTTCFADLDCSVESRDVVLQALEASDPVPSLIIDSGGGYHAYWLLEAPESDLVAWKAVQRGIVARLGDLGADPVVAPDRARILRLVPFANRKYSQCPPTRIARERTERYTLAQLTAAFVPPVDDTLPDLDAGDVAASADDAAPFGMFADRQLTADQLQEMVDVTVATRHVLRRFVMEHMQIGVHFGIIPGYDGRPASKPTLLKAGAELICLLLGLTGTYTADTDTIAMYGQPATGVFAYKCVLKDRRGQTVGEGRGVAELREPTMYNSPNVAAKMAMKRATVDATLRAAGLSNFFTQDLDEPLPPPPASPPPEPEQTRAVTSLTAPVTRYQVRTIKAWLRQTGTPEADLLRKLQIGGLDALSEKRADKLIERLRELAQAGSITVALGASGS